MWGIPSRALSEGGSLIVVIVAVLMMTAPVAAIPAPEEVHTKTQPDGTEFDAVQWGDEWSHGWETESGYTILQNRSTGWWYYAEVEDGSLVASDLKVGIDSPDGLEKHLRRSRSSAASPAGAPSGTSHGSCSGEIPSTGDVSVPVLMANFTDTAPSTTTQQFDELLFGTDPAAASGPGSLNDYFDEASHGNLNLTGGPEGVSGWYTSANGEAYYGSQQGGRVSAQAPELVAETVRNADNRGFDFSQYDNNGDGCVAVVVIHQGAGEEVTRNRDDIWSHRWSLARAPTTSPVQVDGVTVNSYSLQPETAANGNINTIGVFAHEMGHLLGLPDLYDTDYSSEGIGRWGLMGSGSYNSQNRNGDSPSHPTVWSKNVLGWGSPEQISGSGEAGIVPQAEETPLHYRLGSNPGGPEFGQPGGGEYFLVSNRRQTGFDSGLPGEGMLIWHINESNRNNTDENNKLVDLEAADGSRDLDNRRNRGDPGDPFPGSTSQRRFSDSTTPSAEFYDGGQSGIDLRDIRLRYTSATFNGPTNKALDAGESASYAVPVGRETTLFGFIPVTDPVEATAAWEQGRDVDVTLSPPSNPAVSTIRPTSRTPQFARVDSGIILSTIFSGGWKLTYDAGPQDVELITATNYPMAPLPSEASIQPGDMRAGNASSPGTVEFNVTVETANEPYTYQGFGQPDASHFNVTVGNRQVPTSSLALTQVNNREDKYRLKFVAPKQPASGSYDLTVNVTDTKFNVSHTATTTRADAITYSSGGGATGQTATALVIDASGSMYGSKIDNARQAATDYVSTVSDADYITVVSFDSFPRTRYAIARVGGNESSMVSSINNIGAGGSTNIGGGLDTGFQQLQNTPGNTSDAAILLTDGYHNYGQRPLPIADKYRNAGIPIYTIGLGGADDALLQEIASRTGGEFYRTGDPQNLQNIYNDIRTVVSQASTIHTASGTLSPDNTTTQQFGIDDSVDSANLRVQLSSSSTSAASGSDTAHGGSLPAVRLQYPNGTTVPYNTTGGVSVDDPRISYVDLGDTVVHQLTRPQSGTWGYAVNNTGSQSLDYDAQVTGSAAATLSVSTDAAQYVNGSAATLSASLVNASGGVSNATVTATVTLPDGNTTTTTLTERAAGTYRADVPSTQVGSYSATITARAGSLSRQKQLAWTVVDQASVLSVNVTDTSAPTAAQGGVATTSVRLSRPSSSSTATAGTNGSTDTDTAAAGTDFDAAAAELAASPEGSYDPATVSPELRAAADILRNSSQNASAVLEASTNATATGPSAGPSLASGQTRTYLSVSALAGPNGSTIDRAQLVVRPSVVTLGPGTNRTVTVRAQVPAEATPGVYTGTLRAFVGGTAITRQIRVNVTRATADTYRVRIRQASQQWAATGPVGKAYYEERIADHLTRIYFDTAGNTSGSNSTAPATARSGAPVSPGLDGPQATGDRALGPAAGGSPVRPRPVTVGPSVPAARPGHASAPGMEVRP